MDHREGKENILFICLYRTSIGFTTAFFTTNIKVLIPYIFSWVFFRKKRILILNRILIRRVLRLKCKNLRIPLS